jgi:hypothetical protein
VAVHRALGVEHPDLVAVLIIGELRAPA